MSSEPPAASSARPATPPPTGPPRAERRPVVISAHADDRVDDWYWLRERSDPAVMALLEAENAWTEQETARLHGLQAEIYEAILSHTQLTDVTYPAPKGDWAYYTRTEEGLEHVISCRRPDASQPPRPDRTTTDPDESVVLDENKLAEGHDYFQIGDTALSPDQHLLAYAADVTGGELMTVKVRDLRSGEDLPDTLDGAYYGLAFAADNRTLFYTKPDAAMRPFQVWRHTLGSPQDDDVLVAREDDERFFLGVGSTKDARYIVLQSESNITSEIQLLPADDPAGTPTTVEPRREGVLYSLEHHHGELLIVSNDEAENFQLWRAPVTDPSRGNWEVLLAHRDDVRIESVDVIDGFALVEERGHATTTIRVLPLSGDGSIEPVLIEAPEAGTIFLAQNLDFNASALRFQTTSLISPRHLWSFDLSTGERDLLRVEPTPGYDESHYRTERRWAKSDDGTEIPITLAWRAGGRDGAARPCLLYGYGAYEASMDPTMRVDRPIHPILDRGAVYAIAHVRGGGELGRRWYLDGKLENKHHSFEDFVACARHLVATAVTSSDQLAAMGRSAGGLLMGASVNLAVDAFACIVAEVPFVDCLTSMLDASLPLTATEWEEWGNPIESEEAYQFMKAYSPYDNVRAEPYPLMLVTAGLNDPRVSYFEPAKWVQKLRAADVENERRILFRTELSAGHGGPSGRYQSWKERALVLSFVLDAIGAA